METAQQRLRAAGARIEEVELSPRFAEALDAQWLILRFEFARALAFERTQRRTQLSERLRLLLDDGIKIPPAAHAAAQALGCACRAEIARVFEGYDATQHFMANHTFKIDGDAANCVTYMRARHVLTIDGVVEHYTIGGYYDCDFVRTSAGWKMSVRRLITTWREGERSLSDQAREVGRQKLGLA